MYIIKTTIGLKVFLYVILLFLSLYISSDSYIIPSISKAIIGRFFFDSGFSKAGGSIQAFTREKTRSFKQVHTYTHLVVSRVASHLFLCFKKNILGPYIINQNSQKPF